MLTPQHSSNRFSQDNASPNTGDVSPTQDILSGTQDITVSADPSLSGIDPSVNEKWEKTLEALQGRMTRATFDHHLRGSRVIHVQGDTWTVQIVRRLSLDWLVHRSVLDWFEHRSVLDWLEHRPVLDWLEHRMASLIDETLAFYFPGVRVRFVRPGDLSPEPPDEPGPTGSRRPIIQSTPPPPTFVSRLCSQLRPQIQPFSIHCTPISTAINHSHRPMYPLCFPNFFPTPLSHQN